MAQKSLKFCGWLGCNELSRGTYCEKHQAMMDEKRAEEKAKYQKTRPSPRKIGYDATWERCRAMYLARHPLCEACETAGRITPAVLVHHRQRLVDGGARLDPRNLMSLCDACHNEIHKGDRWQK